MCAAASTGDCRRQGRGYVDHALHLRHHRALEGRDAVGRRLGAGLPRHGGFDKLNDRDEVIAYLPLAWVGDHYLNYGQALVTGFCVNCPESPETAVDDRREIGATFFFAPPRVFEGMLTRIMIRMEDAGALKRKMFHHFLGVAKKWGEKILNGERCRSRRGCTTSWARCWSMARSRT
jgi:long-subunit acyl-CoA synthetase (AMP-forming)